MLSHLGLERLTSVLLHSLLFIYTCNPWGLDNFFFNFLLFFLGPHPWHMEVSRLGVKLELQLLAYNTDTATWDPSHVCGLHHNSHQCWILDSLCKSRDRTSILMDTSWICFRCATNGYSLTILYPRLFTYIISLCICTVKTLVQAHFLDNYKNLL